MKFHALYGSTSRYHQEVVVSYNKWIELHITLANMAIQISNKQWHPLVLVGLKHKV